ncbi:MAG TPA: response regulator transcription factor [Firmicutes bacterium]|nr:response regulator transcription factor [Bacillota bacterium]
MIYIVEDDSNICELEQYALKNNGFETAGFGDGKSFFEACRKQLPELVILDIMLPDQNGLDILKTFREGVDTRNIPVVMVTAKDSEIDVVKCLDQGADDYISKPFGLMEFISRIRAVLRRTQKQAGAAVQSFREIQMDGMTRRVTVAGREVDLAYKEYELLRFFIENPNKVLTREELMNRVWNTDFSGESRTLDIHIRTLRHKLGEAGNYIHTVRKVGYQLTFEGGEG